ncbi:hypothetical protein LINPERHAP2_LOCUS12399 [Linum perenne]
MQDNRFYGQYQGWCDNGVPFDEYQQGWNISELPPLPIWNEEPPPLPSWPEPQATHYYRDYKEEYLHSHQYEQHESYTDFMLNKILSTLRAPNVVNVKIEQQYQLMEEDSRELVEENDNLAHDCCELEVSDEESLTMVVDEDVELIHLLIEAEDEHPDIEELSSFMLPSGQPVVPDRDEHMDIEESPSLVIQATKTEEGNHSEVYELNYKRNLDDIGVEQTAIIEYNTPYYLFPPPVGKFAKKMSSEQNQGLLEHHRQHLAPSDVLFGTKPPALKNLFDFKELLSWGP